MLAMIAALFSLAAWSEALSEVLYTREGPAILFDNPEAVPETTFPSRAASIFSNIMNRISRFEGPSGHERVQLLSSYIDVQKDA